VGSGTSLLVKPLDAIVEADLQSLIDNKVAEAKSIEYKSLLPGPTDAEKREFLSDVSSFANTIGGDIFYGILESSGVPTELRGMQVEDSDALKLRLEDIMRHGIQPRIAGIALHVVPLQSSAKVVIIRIPRSWAAPHMVSFQNYSRFFGRNSAGKYQLDVTEIRAAFLLSENASERIRGFRADRLVRIRSGDTPVPLKEGAKIVFHMIPLGALERPTSLSVASLKAVDLQPMAVSSWSYRLNFDGALGYSHQSYLQVFRNGVLESVEGLLLDDGKIPCIAYEKELLDVLSQYFSIGKRIGVDPPSLVMLSLLGVRGYTMATGQPFSGEDRHQIDRQDLLAPPAIIEDYQCDPPEVMRPAFDSIWNACGYPRSLNYDKSGKWVGIDRVSSTS
jgi:hypothetical protein